MNKTPYFLVIFFLISSFFIACDDDDPTDTDNSNDFSKVEVQDFIWQGLNLYYLWKDYVPNLDNSKDDNADSYFNLLNSNSDPEIFFESLIYDRDYTDKWSWIVDDYIALENLFEGISTSNGVQYRLTYENDNNIDVIGYVRYIQTDSDASTKDVKRGYFFDAINGQQLTVNNYQELLSYDTYTMNFADLTVDGTFVSNGKSVELTKSEYHENPVYITKTFDIAGVKIGYLMYNSFTSSYDQQLNAAFGQLKADGATELVLDLRYNGGGSVRTATYMAGMITGQFNGQLFTKEKWNNELQEWFDINHPDWLINNFTDEIYEEDEFGNVILQESINSLNLTTLYVITTGSSASASELIINGLNPYINVITVGTTTTGKYTASITLYDSDNFGRDGANPNHTWAMQPIVLEEINAVGENDKDGFDPTVEVIEYVSEMQELGTETEPLLAEAISLITGVSTKNVISKEQQIQFVEIKDVSKFQNLMYVEKELPSGLRKL